VWPRDVGCVIATITAIEIECSPFGILGNERHAARLGAILDLCKFDIAGKAMRVQKCKRREHSTDSRG
jgi:hypothetical protein